MTKKGFPLKVAAEEQTGQWVEKKHCRLRRWPVERHPGNSRGPRLHDTYGKVQKASRLTVGALP